MTTNLSDVLTRKFITLAVSGACLAPALVLAQPTAHYVPGIEGIKGASLPPPGFYLRDYNVAYFADRLNDSQGNKVGAFDSTDAFIYANVPRLLWITDLKVLGGNIGVDALLPLQYTDLDFKPRPGVPAPTINESTFGIGDVFGEVTWSAHVKHFDVALGYGIWAPTGETDTPSDAGHGFWTHMFTAGATWYVDAEKKWAISALNRYEINHEHEDAGYTPGQAYTLEYGVSYGISPTVDVGVAGYYQTQVTEDSGNRPKDLDNVAGVGPEVSVFYPKYMLGWSLRYAYEFMAEDRLQGHTAALTLTKRF